MAFICVVNNHMVTFRYVPETDEEYSKCMWADFILDLDGYNMIINSDCGNYTYTGWKPTPDTESFMHLCQRLDEGYLLEKFSDRTQFALEPTVEALKDYIIADGMLDIVYINEERSQKLFEELKAACKSGGDDRTIMDNIEEVLDDYGLKGCYEDYDICCCIQKDYPIGIKTLVDIYLKFVVPRIKDCLEATAIGD